MKYIIGTRGSKLALVQAKYVQKKMKEAYPEDEYELKIISTKGDQIQDRPLNQIGAKGLFVKEIEDQILNDQIQIGVHSMKDMPAYPEAGLCFIRAWKREDPRDVLILREAESLSSLREHAVIGTGSKRRAFQLMAIRPDLQIVDIRGNVDTRLRKMQEQKLDGIVLAAAGLKRLGLEDVITQYLDDEEMIHAPAQGILAIEIKAEHTELKRKLDVLADPDTNEEAIAERGFLAEIGGDCHIPVGAACRKAEDGCFELRAMYGNEDGSRIAFSHQKGNNPKELAKCAAKEIRRKIAGNVALVGAGPGDPGLITRKGLEAIQKADCIIYDRLAAPELLAEADPGCERIYVGKENHHHTMPQEKINELLVEKAMQYEHVVRLKGGDVYVFGRGGEEGIFLKEHGVPFTVIPGITSAIAGPAYAGIPITHRGISNGFHVVTAHSRKDELSDLDFASMAKSKETKVFLMGLSVLKTLMDKLMEAKMPSDTPVAVISNATCCAQRTSIGTIADIADKAKKDGIVSPALIVVGDVVNLRDELDFFENGPLFGKRYLVPKIGTGESKLTRLLKKQGAVVDEVTVGEIVSKQLIFRKEELQSVDWMIFTSRNGVTSFFESLYSSGLDTRAIGNAKIAAVGNATAKMLKDYGICADFIPVQHDGASLAEAIKEKVCATDQVWYLKAENARDYLSELLEQFCHIGAINVYENMTVPFDTKIKQQEYRQYDALLFTCASSAGRLLGGMKTDDLKELPECISIGPQCTKALKELGVKHIRQASDAGYENMMDLLLE